MTYKCDKCGYEWNARGEGVPKQCADHCGSREIRMLTSVVNKADVNKDSVNKPEMLTADVNRIVDAEGGVYYPSDGKFMPSDRPSYSKFMDSVACPGIYMVCREHGKRYCVDCGTAVPAPPTFPAAVWTEVYNNIVRGRQRAKKADSTPAPSHGYRPLPSGWHV
jgi:DNA-directed RNA polymerase subunit RPC12/RpoP